MADKKKLTTSFGTSRKRTKPSLDEIDKIANATSNSAPTPPLEAGGPTPPAPAAAPRKKPAAPPKAPAAKQAAPAPPPEPEPVAMKKTSVDLPLELYQELKIHLIKNQTKFREYLTDLIEKDFKKHRK
jgi:hypothetical protein